jgi:acyl carrier protein
MLTIKDVRDILTAQGNELVEYLSDDNLANANFGDELEMDSLDFENLKADIEYKKEIQIPEEVSTNDTVREFIDRINESNF